jgi:type I restriction enzyme M protein
MGYNKRQKYFKGVKIERKVEKKSLPLPSNILMTNDQERAELHRAIWQIANNLRGSVDGWNFKQYVLGMLFYRFISENLTSYINADERRSGTKDFDYGKLADKKAEFGRADTVKEKGFYILPSELFVNVRSKTRNDANLNETLTKVFRNIEKSAKGSDSEDDLKGLFDDLDVNASKLGDTVEKRNQKLVKLLDAIGDLRLGNYYDNTIDAFGDAYEFLMTMYASNAGKSGGEFFTPQEVSELLAEITTVGKKEVNKVYDPACGSGSLLLKFVKVLGKENVRIGFFGQEVNLTIYNLCRINMFLHDINYNHFDITHGDTLTDPKHWDDEPFDAIVSNPPYSIRWEGDSNPLLINDPRFSPAGVLAPKSKADLAFTMHMLSWLSTSGTAAIVEFPGVLYRGGAEQKIRKYLVDNNYIDTVIQLPPDLFFGTNIATCIIVLKKSKKDNKTLFIDASAEFVRGGNKNKLTDENRAKIMEAFIQRTDRKHFAKLVSNKTLEENDYNIGVSTFVAQKDTREIIDIKKLNAEIAGIVAWQNKLRKAIDEIVANFEGSQ